MCAAEDHTRDGLPRKCVQHTTRLSELRAAADGMLGGHAERCAARCNRNTPHSALHIPHRALCDISTSASALVQSALNPRKRLPATVATVTRGSTERSAAPARGSNQADPPSTHQSSGTYKLCGTRVSTSRVAFKLAAISFVPTFLDQRHIAQISWRSQITLVQVAALGHELSPTVVSTQIARLSGMTL
mmetsp:Transcript_8909/g.23364  ORF Transcript_8909/g.23364 Transcript_8909/m.23364 type:complete len:189 (+) Transcript_8909:273-839(+)